MASEHTAPSYRAFACGFDCHYERYTLFTRRNWLGIKRWGIHDQHLDVALPARRPTELAANEWRVWLELMELREREYKALRADKKRRMGKQ